MTLDSSTAVWAVGVCWTVSYSLRSASRNDVFSAMLVSKGLPDRRKQLSRQQAVPRLQGTPRALAGPPPEAGAKAREGRRAFGRCPGCQTRHEYDPPGR